MKKIALVVLAVSLIFVAACAEVAKSQPAKVKTTKLTTSKHSKAISKCEQEAQTFIKKANQASSKGQTDLAKAYNDCAAAQKEIAEGYRADDNSMVKEGQKAFKESLDNVKKIEHQPKTKKVKSGCQDQVTKYQEMSDAYLKKANNAKEKGKRDLAAAYNDCANACGDIADAMKSCVNCHAKCEKICNDNPELSSLKSDQKENCIGKKSSLDEMNKSIQNCLNKADQLEKEGNAQLADAYKNLADAKKTQLECCKKAEKAKLDLAVAKKKIKQELKNGKVSSKTEKKTNNNL